MVVYFNVIGWKRDQESGEANKLQRGLRISRICRKPTWCGDAPQSQSSLIGFSTRLKCTRVYLLGLIAIIRLVAPPSLRSASPRHASCLAAVNKFFRPFIHLFPPFRLPSILLYCRRNVSRRKCLQARFESSTVGKEISRTPC